MILAHGQILENSAQDAVIAALEGDVSVTLCMSTPVRDAVIAACDRLSRRAMAGEFDAIVQPLLELHQLSYATYLDYCRMFSAEGLRQKLEIELRGLPVGREQISAHLARELRPLGVLLHIAAGNVDVLPAYSVVEGLLAGNINLLKLPSGDSGLSVKLLGELIAECPTLADYIYVFDVPSTELETIRRLADVADAVVVWGSDAAVEAAHRFIKPNTRLISWGHKLSFAYATPDCSDAMLEAVAEEICRTNQMLCSSCQGIYVDTADRAQLAAFGARFFAILRRVNARVGPAPRGMRGKNTLKLYTDRLEGRDSIFSADGVSVVIREDSALELSYLFRNVWVKALPHDAIVPTLKPRKGYLQTCALLTAPGDAREGLIDALLRAGLTRITDPTVPQPLPGEAHDGFYPLREYTRVVDIYCG